MAPNLGERSRLPEKMDDPGVPEKEVFQALRELETINTYLGGYSVILSALNKLHWPKKEMVIMDLGCGGGDTLRAIARWAKNKNRRVKLIGIDRNPLMTAFAARQSGDFPNIRYLTCDVFDDNLATHRPDITMNSLFCHHFDDDALTRLIKRMYQLSSHAVIINDLHRHWFAYHSIAVLTRLFSRTYLVRYDAPLSVARSFKKEELRQILYQAGIRQFNLTWRWAWRWELIIKKDTIEYQSQGRAPRI